MIKPIKTSQIEEINKNLERIGLQLVNLVDSMDKQNELLRKLGGMLYQKL